MPVFQQLFLIEYTIFNNKWITPTSSGMLPRRQARLLRRLSAAVAPITFFILSDGHQPMRVLLRNYIESLSDFFFKFIFRMRKFHCDGSQKRKIPIPFVISYNIPSSSEDSIDCVRFAADNSEL